MKKLLTWKKETAGYYEARNPIGGTIRVIAHRLYDERARQAWNLVFVGVNGDQACDDAYARKASAQKAAETIVRERIEASGEADMTLKDAMAAAPVSHCQEFHEGDVGKVRCGQRQPCPIHAHGLCVTCGKGGRGRWARENPLAVRQPLMRLDAFVATNHGMALILPSAKAVDDHKAANHAVYPPEVSR